MKSVRSSLLLSAAALTLLVAAPSFAATTPMAVQKPALSTTKASTTDMATKPAHHRHHRHHAHSGAAAAATAPAGETK